MGIKLNKKKLKRLDQIVLDRRLADSLAKAQALIMAGKIVVEDQRVDKPGATFQPQINLRLKSQGKFVSRGGDKLEDAIKKLNLQNSFENKVVLDIGSSTGGFTDCSLHYKAKLVLALDVGSNQLAWKLRTSPQVISLEKTDIRDFIPINYQPIDWIIGDISFNSICNLLESVVAASQSYTKFLLLVKPQFELNPQEIPEGGIVLDEQLRSKALNKVIEKVNELGLELISTVDCDVKGRYGNQEIFIFFKKK